MSHIKKLVSKKTGKVSYRVHIRTATKQITKTFKRKTEATQFSKTIEGNSILSQSMVDPILNLTLNQALDNFKPKTSDNSIHNRLAYFAKHFGDIKLQYIKSSHIKSALDELLKTRAVATRNRYLSDFGTFTKWVQEQTGLEYHPHRILSRLNEGKGRQDYLTFDEQNKLLKACKAIDADKEVYYLCSPTKKLYLYILISLSCGLRKGEVEALEWRDILWNDKVLIVRAETKGAKKTGYREVPFNELVKNELESHRDISIKGLLFPSKTHPEKVYVFRKQWQKARKNAGIKDSFVQHSLRHTCASNMAKAGQSLMQIGVILGHSSAQTTLRYAHLVERKDLHQITEKAMLHLVA